MRSWVALMVFYSAKEFIPLFFEVILLFPYDFLWLLFFFFWRGKLGDLGG
jgi:hypothetical protein